MDEILKFLTQNPTALMILGALLGLLFLSITIIYIIAFFQGREISFWPPKIGGRLTNKEQKELETRKEIPNDIDKVLSKPDNDSDLPLPFKRSDILMSASTLNDCHQLSIATEEILDFIFSEAIRHPALFISTFSSIPLVFQNSVIFLSWDGSQVNVERILNRSEAYPTTDSWFTCVSLYRQATALPYRNKKTKAILTETEIHHIINLYRKLLRNIKNFSQLSKIEGKKQPTDTSAFESLLDEAEFALLNEGFDIGIVRLEALLSSLHKFILSHAPQAISIGSQKSESTTYSTPKLSNKGGKSILLVDDHKLFLEGLSSVIKKDGYRIATASNGEEALKAMVENDYDLVITDFFMPILDGREVTIGAKMISPKTKIVLLTMHEEASKMASEIHYDHIFLKDVSVKKLLSFIRNLLDETSA